MSSWNTVSSGRQHCFYFSLDANLTAKPASARANACCSRFTAFDEFVRYALTPLARMPYSANTNNVMPMNTALSRIISSVGDVAFLETDSGKKAKKKIV